jgi:hypothetical protein
MQPLNYERLKIIYGILNLDTNQFPKLEGMIFDYAGEYTSDYNGGQWAVERIGEYVYLRAPEGSYNVASSENYYQGTMDAQTYGIALTVLIYNRLLWWAAENGRLTGDALEKASDHFYALRDNALENVNPEVANEIVAFLD